MPSGERSRSSESPRQYWAGSAFQASSAATICFFTLSRRGFARSIEASLRSHTVVSKPLYATIEAIWLPSVPHPAIVTFLTSLMSTMNRLSLVG